MMEAVLEHPEMTLAEIVQQLSIYLTYSLRSRLSRSASGSRRAGNWVWGACLQASLRIDASSRSHVYMLSCGLRSLYDSALGFQALASKNADPQNSRAWMSNLASWAFLAACSPVAGQARLLHHCVLCSRARLLGISIHCVVE